MTGLNRSVRATKEAMMKTTVRATYSNGTLTLERILDFAEGERVTVTVESQPDLPFPSSGQSAVDILAEAPGQLLFKSGTDVAAYLDEERASWES
ncbi:MAG: DUF104 domain-containing protein [Chloroflexota bacterium]|nr:DUF104 domain-containing protein [Chloroflexota bacterium]MDE2683273.1 DUF104 domain-containing protein [Chloroflexota bacterium]